MSDTDTKTIERFIQEQGLSMDVEPSTTNPNINPSEWDPDATHWKVTLHSATTGEKMGTYFTQGSAFTEPPTIMDVLDALASDAAGAEESFDNWCSEYGYDTDSRKALATYEAIQQEARALSKLVGWYPKEQDAYSELLYKIERL